MRLLCRLGSHGLQRESATRSVTSHQHCVLAGRPAMLVPEGRGPEADEAVRAGAVEYQAQLNPGVVWGGYRGSSVSALARDAMCAGLKNSGTGRAPANMLANSSMAFWLPAMAASSCCICGGGGTARSAS